MTDEAKFILLQLYSIYLDRLEDGQTKQISSYFGNAKDSYNNFFLGLNFEDYIEAVFELKSKHLVSTLEVSDNFVRLQLTSDGIAYSESTSKKDYKVLLGLIKDLKSLIV
ncbi:TPA: hypothetical protein ACOD0T_002465 [Staphylococcus aureus]|uniref:Uncharacterized protein n=1 Tax=Staphylococcus aureus TaxID=1280 RepID=A0A517JRJ9_STAAU|nr:hypothetical protein [Staphylococcus aureus]MBU9772306.1 hypothetical protein [Staphylococcus aureus]MBU9795469.1 hypothetical protein [Staphylococcus aureus]NDP74691.1 hypothetical protein [Staphylococcus aureus]NFY02179.1 hypothetical protein [Staphylococcus aureus]PGG85043.1 hypothetical protein CRU85_13100 [Staphylococcus aureus]